MRRSAFQLAAVLAVAAASGLWITACGEGAASRESVAEANRQWDRYAVRGRIVAVIDGGRVLSVHHEAIPDFVGYGGEVVGMEPMVMELEPAAGEPVSSLTAGDLVSFTLAHSWQPMPIRTQIEQVRRLPPGTVLVLDGEGSAPAAVDPEVPATGESPGAGRP